MQARVIPLQQPKNWCVVRYNMRSCFTYSKSPYSNFPNQSDWSHVNLASRNNPKTLKFCILSPHWFLMTDAVFLNVIYVNPV